MMDSNHSLAMLDRTTRPLPTEYAPYYGAYVARVPDGDVVETLRTQIAATLTAVRAQGEAIGGRRYAEGKWTVREVLGHIIDTERIFAYRALRFARADETELASFDENTYVANGFHDARSVSSLCEEFELVRRSNVALFDTLNATEWQRSGIASKNRMSVRALAWVTAGHELHHLHILTTRYW